MKQEDWDQRYRGAALLWGVAPNRFVEESLAGLAPGTAIDLAAGEGRNAIWLAEHGWRVVAVDFSGVAVERGREIAVKRGVEVEWQQADLDDYVPSVSSYDLVLIAYLHMPWPRMRPILQRAAAAVRPGGTFFLIGHDRRNLADGYGGPRSEAVLYGPDDVAGVVSELDILRAETVVRVVQTENGQREALDVLVRAIRG